MYVLDGAVEMRLIPTFEDDGKYCYVSGFMAISTSDGISGVDCTLYEVWYLRTLPPLIFLKVIVYTQNHTGK